MPREFEHANPEILTVGTSGRDSHCKICGIELKAGTAKLQFSHHGTRLSFCFACVKQLFKKLMLRR